MVNFPNEYKVKKIWLPEYLETVIIDGEKFYDVTPYAFFYDGVYLLKKKDVQLKVFDYVIVKLRHNVFAEPDRIITLHDDKYKKAILLNFSSSYFGDYPRNDYWLVNSWQPRDWAKKNWNSRED
jgi:hypothetical protein